MYAYLHLMGIFLSSVSMVSYAESNEVYVTLNPMLRRLRRVRRSVDMVGYSTLYIEVKVMNKHHRRFINDAELRRSGQVLALTSLGLPRHHPVKIF